MKLKNDIKDFKSGLDSIVSDLGKLVDKIDFLLASEVEIIKKLMK